MPGASSLSSVMGRLDCRRNLADYVRIWGGYPLSCCLTCRPVSLVLYYSASAESELRSLTEEASRITSLTITPYRLESSTLPINKLKNIAIRAVVTTHFIFAENNLAPTSVISFHSSSLANLYSDILHTPGYLWRDPYFAGVVPVYEWSDDRYDEAKSSYQ